MSQCYSWWFKKKKDEVIYNASSPDELALLNFAKFCGYNFNGIDESSNYEYQFKE